MEGVTAKLAMDKLVTVVQYFQAFDRSDGEVKKRKEGHAAVGW
jgi:hypothetical protein